MGAHYMLGILGSISKPLVKKLRSELQSRLKELGLGAKSAVQIVVGQPENFRPLPGRCSAAICFQCDIASEPHLKKLMESGVPIIPVAPTRVGFSRSIPQVISTLNGLCLDETPPEKLVLALLECAGLLPRQRRVFISYRRTEATQAALQLYAALSARGFEVFLDTHKIHPGEHFQEVLWQRLSDCDVLVMLDTKGYFDSRWTAEEFGRAAARGLAFVRVGWPNVRLDPKAQIAFDIPLKRAGFQSRGKLFEKKVLERVCNSIELARTTSVSVRFEQLIETLRLSLRRIGGSVDGVSLRRSIRISLPKKKPITAFPVLGVPTSFSLQEATLEKHHPPAAVVYDDFGVNERNWRSHMQWIGGHLQHVVRLVPCYKAGVDLVGWRV